MVCIFTLYSRIMCYITWVLLFKTNFLKEMILRKDLESMLFREKLNNFLSKFDMAFINAQYVSEKVVTLKICVENILILKISWLTMKNNKKNVRSSWNSINIMVISNYESPARLGTLESNFEGRVKCNPDHCVGQINKSLVNSLGRPVN